MYTTVTSPDPEIMGSFGAAPDQELSPATAPAYSREEIEKRRLVLDPLLKSHRMLTRNSTRYWIQNFWPSMWGKKFPALVLDVIRNKYAVLLTDVLIIAEVKRENGQNLHEARKSR